MADQAEEKPRDGTASWLVDHAPDADTERFQQMDRYEAFAKATQYAHQQVDWWGLSADQTETVSPKVLVAPGFEQPQLGYLVRGKRPTAPYHLAKTIVDRFTGLLLSETRRPEIAVENDPDTEEWLKAVFRQCRFWPTWRMARFVGGAVGTVCVTAHLRKGRFALEVHNGKHLTVLWKDRRTFTPRGILKQYRYFKEEMVQTDSGERQLKQVQYLYRRVITETEDIVFKPLKIDGATRTNDMQVADSVRHDLGFFPGVWVQNKPVLDDDDGDPDCQGAWQTLDTIDRLLAQMNKGALLNLDPTLVQKIDPRVIDLGGGVMKGSDNAINVGPDGAASYLEMTGTGIRIGMELVDRFRQNVLDMTACVLVDPNTISGAAQSAKAIEFIYAPMLEQADVLRGQYGDLGFLPMCEILIRMAKRVTNQFVKTADGRAGQLMVDVPPRVVTIKPGPNAPAGAKIVTQVLDRKLGPGGHIKCMWGPYFSPTEQDRQLSVQTTVAAEAGKIIDQETAIRSGAEVFGVKDVDQMVTKIRDESDRADQNAWGPVGGAMALPPEFGQPDGQSPHGGAGAPPPAAGGGRP